MTTPALPLAAALTGYTERLCSGLDDGSAELYARVTPVTAELLRWWFADDACQGRAVNFHAGQRTAILNTIVAHEVLRAAHPAQLYRLLGIEADADALHASDHPKYCLKMATGTGKTWVLQALLAWQVLNRTASLEAGDDDPRFTRRFLIVAPGLIVYERLVAAFLGRQRDDGTHDASTADFVRHGELFLPPQYREQVQQFVRGNLCRKPEIGLKATANGLIALTNWHLLSDAGDAAEADDEADAAATPDAVVRAVLPVVPGRAAGNALEVLDRRWTRGNVLAYLAGLPDLLVFNDEAHHIHDVRSAGEITEVEWQKSLQRIAAGKRRFAQIDFSATPYNEVGSGRRRRPVYFPHIVADFDLRAAMRAGLVKALVLDRRRELGALPLDFHAVRGEDGRPVALSDGQRTMLRAGLEKLRRLERDFAVLDPTRRPKMLVVCEDTAVTPLVAAFLQDDGLAPDDVLTVDSGRRAELGEQEWNTLRQALFDVDRRAQPRVIVSVLMLREGFDVDNICVVVPLRTSGSRILLEQTVGRGLRLMWREPEYADVKRDARERIDRGEEPHALLDILSIVEHPAFASWYDELIAEGLVGTTGDLGEGTLTGDLVAVPLRDDHARYDFAIPFVLRDAEASIEHAPIDPALLRPYTDKDRATLAGMLGRGDVFTSQDLQSHTLFGDYRVDGAVMRVGGYNELLSRLTRRIAHGLNRGLPAGNRAADRLAMPYLQYATDGLAGVLDTYIRERLFDGAFEPFDEQESWRLLLVNDVMNHIVREVGLALSEARRRDDEAGEVLHRRLSEVPRILLRESGSIAVGKCIYERQGWPLRSGGLERAFIEWAHADSSIEAFCRISETRHDFVRLRYVRDDGAAAWYSPDFLVRTGHAVFVVETKAQHQLRQADVQRKRIAARAWCSRINALPADQRSERRWLYALVGEDTFHQWRQDGGRLADLLGSSVPYEDLAAPVQATLQW